MMKRVNVIITSAGTSSAINVIKALRLQNQVPISLVAVDTDPLAPGLKLADHGEVVPKVTDSDYVVKLIEVARKMKASILLPIFSRELEIVAKKRKHLEDAGLRLLLPGIETLRTCNDKLKLEALATSLGIDTPKSIPREKLNNIDDSLFPLFVKPRVGSSSIGANKLDDRLDLEYCLAKNPDALVQEFIPGEEITVDVFCDRDHRPLVVAARIRLATKAGQSIKARMIDSDPFVDIVHRMCIQIEMVGACNFQFIKNDRRVVLIEINPRFAAGGLMLTVKAGANIPLLVIKEILGMEIFSKECKVRTNLMMSRYWEEIIY